MYNKTLEKNYWIFPEFFRLIFSWDKDVGILLRFLAFIVGIIMMVGETFDRVRLKFSN